MPDEPEGYPPPFQPGQTSLVGPLNAILASLKRSQVAVAAPLELSHTPDATTLRLNIRRGFWAKLDGTPGTGGSPYVARQVDTRVLPPTVVAGLPSVMAIELNDRPDLAGKVVWLSPGAPGDYRFYEPGAAPTGPIYVPYPGCFCSSIPSILEMTVTPEGCNLGMFNSCTIRYGPTPPEYAGLALAANSC